MRKPAEIVIRKNMFAALYISDSDSEEVEVKEEGAHEVEVEVEVEVEAEVKAESVPQEEEHSYRRWVRPDNGRFASDSSENIFSSPFYKGKRTLSKHWTRPRFVEDNEGWVSIRHGNVEESEKDSGVVYEERPVKEATESSNESSDELSASMWAERIKNTLEKTLQSLLKYLRKN